MIPHTYPVICKTISLFAMHTWLIPRESQRRDVSAQKTSTVLNRSSWIVSKLSPIFLGDCLNLTVNCMWFLVAHNKSYELNSVLSASLEKDFDTWLAAVQRISYALKNYYRLIIPTNITSGIYIMPRKKWLFDLIIEGLADLNKSVKQFWTR